MCELIKHLLFLFSPGQEGAITCETANGDLVEFGISTPATDNDCATGQLQPSLKDLLLGVEVNQAKVSELKSQQQQLNAFLQQINMASYLLHFCHPHTTTNQDAAPISCKVIVQSEVGYHAVDYHVVVHVTNHSAVALTKTWSLVATLFEVNGTGTGGRQSKSKPHVSAQKTPPSSHTLRLSHGLGAGQIVHFKIPVTYSPTCSGLNVNVSLMLHMPELLLGESKHSEASPSCLIIPLSATVVDVFHFLHLRQPGCVLPHAPDPASAIEKRVARLGHSDQSNSHAEKRGAEKQQSSHSYSVSVDVAGKNTKICENLC